MRLMAWLFFVRETEGQLGRGFDESVSEREGARARLDRLPVNVPA